MHLAQKPWAGETRMLQVLAVLTLLLTFADHWTTYLCLRAPVVGWQVVEANPVADWLFDTAGLIPGLAIDTSLTLLVVFVLVVSRRFATMTKCAMLGAIAVVTGIAVANNLLAISSLGLSPAVGGS
jgi:hypothetical protein